MKRFLIEAIRRAGDGGISLAVVILFYFILYVMVVLSTANPKEHPLDTLIALGGAAGQIAVAVMVYRLSKSQFDFMQRTEERQHKIDAYPLRKAALESLEKASKHLSFAEIVSRAAPFDFLVCHREINRLFSDQASQLSYDLWKAVSTASRISKGALPTLDEGGSIIEAADRAKTNQVAELVQEAIAIMTNLENQMTNEMRIR